MNRTEKRKTTRKRRRKNEEEGYVKIGLDDLEC